MRCRGDNVIRDARQHITCINNEIIRIGLNRKPGTITIEQFKPCPVCCNQNCDQVDIFVCRSTHAGRVRTLRHRRIMQQTQNGISLTRHVSKICRIDLQAWGKRIKQDQPCPFQGGIEFKENVTKIHRRFRPDIWRVNICQLILRRKFTADMPKFL